MRKNKKIKIPVCTNAGRVHVDAEFYFILFYFIFVGTDIGPVRADAKEIFFYFLYLKNKIHVCSDTSRVPADALIHLRFLLGVGNANGGLM
jgi:hypothetical protein